MDLAARLCDERADLRAIHRHALTQQAMARRERNARRLRRWRRLIIKCLRALRYIARIEAGRAQDDPSCSHPLFSDSPAKSHPPPAPVITPDLNRRRTLREHRRRR